MDAGPAEVVLGVSGGIAAYKTCELLRRLRESGREVQVVATTSALRFVGAATFEALSGRPVLSEVEMPTVSSSLCRRCTPRSRAAETTEAALPGTRTVTVSNSSSCSTPAPASRSAAASTAA